MKFKKMSVKNFMSVGNTPVEIDLCRSHSTVVGGMNGSGKSAITCEALVYILTGKSMKKTTLPRLVNSTNKKELLVTLDFEKNGHQYTVVRGIKPNIFEIYRNGDMLNQDAAAKDLQEKLEFITGIDYNSLTQMIVLNLERFKPFMEMTAQERRTIVEDILDISIFSEMTDIQKKKIKELESSSRAILNDISVVTAKIDSIQAIIDKSQQSNDKHLTELESDISECFDLIDEYEKEFVGVDEELIVESEEKLQELKKERSDHQSKLQFVLRDVDKIEKDTKFYEKGHCPTCNHEFDDKEEQLKKLTERKDQLFDEGGVLSEAVDELTKQIDELNEIIKQENSKKLENQRVQNKIDNTHSKAVLLASEHEKLLAKTTNDVDDLKDQVEALKNDKFTKSSDYDIVVKKIDTEKIVLDVLSDKGVKSTIVKDYIDFINYRVNDYLSGMEFFLNINLDESFNETFSGLKQGMVYADLSTGQKRRVNLAIWLALIEVSSMKNSVVSNALFLDEILENIDSEGIQLFMKLLKEKMPEKNIFVVTQRFEQFRDLFESELYFKVENGFTRKV